MSQTAASRSKTYLQRLVAGASWCAVIMLWLCAASVYINPVYFRYAGIVGLGFPFFLAGVLFMLALTLLLAPRHAWIPLLGLALSFFSIRSYCPLNFPSSPPKGSIKVVSFNVAGFAGGKDDANGKDEISAYIAEQDPDIACLQEAYIKDQYFKDKVLPLLTSRMAYFDTVKISSNVLMCVSKYRIVKKEQISAMKTNGSAAFTLVPKAGDTIIVINCHLQSMHLSPKDRQEYHVLVREPERSNVDSSSRMLISKISSASVERSQQATQTANFIRRHKGKSIILCGDLNDTPISFAHHRLCSTGLTDAYVASGRGIGRSFNRDAIYVRIDNILCSSDWTPYAAHIDRSFSGSDHYPIIAYLHRKE